MRKLRKGKRDLGGGSARLRKSKRGLGEGSARLRKRKDADMEMRTSYFLFYRLFLHAKFYQAFLLAQRMTDRLALISDEEYNKGNVYFILGEAYFKFRDYEHAIPLLEKAVRDSVTGFTDRSNLRARNTPGIYYAEKGDFEEAGKWFRSMLESPDMVKYRPMYDCIAICNMADMMNDRGQYERSLPLFQAALPVALADRDFRFASGITVNMGECYLAMGNLKKVKEMIDTTFVYIDRSLEPGVHHSRLTELYPLMSRYYARLGNAERSIAYMDSTA
ncbi:MAG: tetratricopeptide repeat protein, partial [Tannerella sp.]|nr:tetratricopeptide repeat protein [Tannerella sp.]